MNSRPHISQFSTRIHSRTKSSGERSRKLEKTERTPGSGENHLTSAAPEPALPSRNAGKRTGPKRILVVDDDPGVRESLMAVLVGEGYVALPAGNGLQALEVVGTTPLDLVLLDLNMPVKNGWDTFERLSYEHPLVPVIIITARPNQLFMAAGAGVGALLEKPLDIPTLLSTITRLLAAPPESHLARLAGREADFFYSPKQPSTPNTRPNVELSSPVFIPTRTKHGGPP